MAHLATQKKFCCKAGLEQCYQPRTQTVPECWKIRRTVWLCIPPIGFFRACSYLQIRGTDTVSFANVDNMCGAEKRNKTLGKHIVRCKRNSHVYQIYISIKFIV